MILFNLPNIATQPGLQKLRRDPLLYGDNGGVLYASDIAFPWSYSPGNPTNAKAIRDIAERNDGAYRLEAGQTILNTGGGLDYSAATIANSYELVPGAVATSLFDQQFFIVCAYFRFPAKNEWKSGAGMNSWLQASPSSNSFQATPDLVTIGPAAGYTMRFYRQRSAASNDQDAEFMPVDDAHFGSVCQVAYWRNAAGQGCRIKNGSALVQRTKGVGANNSQDFRGQAIRVGAALGFWSSPLAGDDLLSRRFRHYRTFVENLAVSGRDPVAVLDADLARVLARGAFS